MILTTTQYKPLRPFGLRFIMKRLTISIILAFLSIKSNSAVFSHTDYISRIGAIESRENGDFIILAGFTFAGTCPLSGGLVVARLKSTEYGCNKVFIH